MYWTLYTIYLVLEIFHHDLEIIHVYKVHVIFLTIVIVLLEHINQESNWIIWFLYDESLQKSLKKGRLFKTSNIKTFKFNDSINTQF